MEIKLLKEYKYHFLVIASFLIMAALEAYSGDFAEASTSVIFSAIILVEIRCSELEKRLDKERYSMEGKVD